MQAPYREIRASYTEHTLTVYQAYGPQIAVPAAATGRFTAAFKLSRMTWIKPSFLWMMYRSGWAAKPGQEHVLAIELTREGFEWALAHSCLSHRGSDTSRKDWAAALAASPVRIQWDPERSLNLQPLPHRSLQVGLSGDAVQRYVNEWIVGITDVTETAHLVHDRVRSGHLAEANALRPTEPLTPLPPALATTIGATLSPATAAPPPPR